MIGKINNYIQKRMRLEHLDEISLTKAAKWLDEANILKDSRTSPGNSLRRHIAKGNILGAFKKNNYFWYIKKDPKYSPILTAQELSQLFNLKCRTSLYRKIHKENIPYRRHQQKGIYFFVSDLLRWALERNNTEFFEKLRSKYTSIDTT